MGGVCFEEKETIASKKGYPAIFYDASCAGLGDSL